MKLNAPKAPGLTESACSILSSATDAPLATNVRRHLLLPTVILLTALLTSTVPLELDLQLLLSAPQVLSLEATPKLRDLSTAYLVLLENTAWKELHLLIV